MTANSASQVTQPELFDPANAPDFVRILKDIRDNEEMFFYEGEQYRAWVVSRHDHVVELLRDDRLIQPSLLPRIASFPDAQREQLFPLQEFARLNLGKTRERKLALRQATKQFFMPGSVNRLRARVREIIELLHKDIDPSQPVDLVGRFSYPMPAWVLAEILGVPRSDQHKFIDWSNALIQFFRSYTFEEFLSAQDGVVEMIDYCTGHIERRMREGAGDNDLIDDFARLLEAGEFEIGELATSCATFLMAGHENTSHFIGNLFLMLFSNPKQMAAVRADRSLLGPFMDETLRYRGVVPFVTREVLEDFDFEGRELKTGQLVSLSLFSANRDDSTFTGVDDFDLHNPTAKYHLGFGHGEEYCRGAHLALMEAEELVNFLFDRYSAIDPVEGGMEVSLKPMLRRYITRLDLNLRP